MNEQEAVVYSIYVGIDWADSKHDVCIQPTTSDERVFDVIPHRHNGKRIKRIQATTILTERDTVEELYKNG